LTNVLSNKTIQISKCITEVQIKWSMYISSKRDLKRKIQLVSIGPWQYDTTLLITIDSTKQMWLHSNMYFQVNELIPVTYIFITYYPSIELFRSWTKVNTLYSWPSFRIIISSTSTSREIFLNTLFCDKGFEFIIEKGVPTILHGSPNVQICWP
jgi:predicted choloylglycine hydrolase